MHRRFASSLIVLLLLNTLIPHLAFAQRKKPRPPSYLYDRFLLDQRANPREREQTVKRLRDRFGLDRPSDSETTGLPEELVRRIGSQMENANPSGQLRLALPRAIPDRAAEEYIKWCQTGLNLAIGAGLKVDGKNGPETRGKIREFQTKNGLKADGIVGPRTERQLADETNTQPPLRLASTLTREYHRLTVRSMGPGPAIDPLWLNDACYVDVQSVDGATRVLVWLGAMRDAPPERLDPDKKDVLRLETAEELLALAFAGSRTLIVAGEQLPPTWDASVRSEDVTYVRASQQSPKRTLVELAEAAKQLSKTYEKGKTKIISFLPRARGEEELTKQLESLGRPANQAPDWKRWDVDVTASEKDAGYTLEQATKPSFFEELRTGSSDVLVLFAHSEDGSIRSLDGPITSEELADIHRDKAPPRTIVLFSCETGEVNAKTISIAEMLVRNGLATTVMAPPGPVSAREVPDLLRRYVGGGTLNEVFRRGPLLMNVIGLRLDGELTTRRLVES